MTLLFNLLCCLYRLVKLQQKQTVDTFAKIIERLVQIMFMGILTLTSVLVFVYKIRSGDQSTTYNGLLEWSIVQPLNQVKLGQLIYNYGGAGLFVLGGLFYVTKRASLLTIDVKEQGNYLSSFFFKY